LVAFDVMGTRAHYIERLSPPAGDGMRVAVKDLVDLAGLPTTCGCRAVAEHVEAAPEDALCLAGFRAAGTRFTGKTNLHELAFGVTGENPWYGTPVNPLDPARVPGGSSSGSAVAVALGEADAAIGTDTGGSIRIPAACCGVAGLKTTVGRIPLAGVRPLAPSFDTVGLLARDVAALSAGFALLAGDSPALPRLAADSSAVARVSGLADVDIDIDTAIDRALAGAELAVEEIALPDWAQAFTAHRVVLGAEAFASDGGLLEGESRLGVGEDVRDKLERGAAVTAGQLRAARKTALSWRAELLGLLGRFTALALPSIPCVPPPLGAEWIRLVWLTAPINLAGLPAVAIPVRPAGPPTARHGIPPSLQLVGAPSSEEKLLALAELIENAAGPGIG
jgi:amidase